jgi:pimeloyl-ACP methyl ester carboxylesterase
MGAHPEVLESSHAREPRDPARGVESSQTSVAISRRRAGARQDRARRVHAGRGHDHAAGNIEIQLNLFLDNANNVKLYPSFQEYFRRSKPPLFAIWGRFDPFFIPPEAWAFRRDNPNAMVQLLDTGHFTLDTHVEEVAVAMRELLAKT